MSERLLSCPFCGRETAKPKSSGQWGWFVGCTCHAVGPNAENKKDAIKAWNTRTEPLQGRLDI